MKRKYSIRLLTLLWLFLAVQILAGPKDPVEGVAFENYKRLQQADLQNALRAVFTEDRGYIIAGPLDPNISNSELLQFYGTVRVICPNLENLLGSSNLLQATPGFAVKGAKQFIDYSLADSLPGFRGMMVRLSWNQKDYGVQFQTVNQLRFMIWAKNIFGDKTNSSEDVNLKRYAAAVSDYLYEIDRNNLETPEPKAASYELPNIVDLYAKAPDYVIQGYENYKNYLFSYSSVTTDFASEVLGFVPSTQTYQKLKSLAPLKAFPNKEAPLLQEELRKFFQRGGNMSGMRTLTKEIYDTLQPGEYFFAVGFNGNMRYGRELTREEVAEIEKSGFKPARANHAFLFPGEPILTAGAFFISCDGDRVLERVNTQSGHYFYSNISSTIKEDISERSDSYFLTIGHFFTSFDTLGIVYNDVVVSKL